MQITDKDKRMKIRDRNVLYRINLTIVGDSKGEGGNLLRKNVNAKVGQAMRSDQLICLKKCKVE